jgi:hypothetical protein
MPHLLTEVDKAGFAEIRRRGLIHPTHPSFPSTAAVISWFDKLQNFWMESCTQCVQEGSSKQDLHHPRERPYSVSVYMQIEEVKAKAGVFLIYPFVCRSTPILDQKNPVNPMGELSNRDANCEKRM